MAQKSKTQRAKASAARAAKKEQAAVAAAAAEAAELEAQNAESVEVDPKEAKKLAKAEAKEAKEAQKEAEAQNKHEEKAAAPKKEPFVFLKSVRSELKRVTWPSRQEVLRWSGVVVVALLFFGIYTAVLDNLIVTPILVLISGLGA